MAQLKSTIIQGALTVTGNVVANKLIKVGGTSDQILMADGSTVNKSDLTALINAAVTIKGTLGTGGTIDSLPTASASNLGYGYKVITAGTYNSVAAKVGDMFICYKDGSSYAWMHIPSGDDIEDTWRPIKLSGTEIFANGNTTKALDFVPGTNIDITHNNSNGSLTFTATDTGATSVETVGDGNAVTTASYSDDTRKLTLTKGSTFALKSELPVDYVKIDISGNSGTLTSAQLAALKANPHKTVLNWSGYYCFAENLSSAPTYYYSANCTFNGTTSIDKKVITLTTSSGAWSYKNYTYENTNTTYGADRGISLKDGNFGHSNTKVTTVTTAGLYKIKYDDYGHITGTESFTLPTVNDGTLTIQTNGTNVATFTANQSGNTTANIAVPDPANYYWANVKVSSTSSTATTPSVQKIGITGSTTATANAAVTMEYDSSYKALKFKFA